MFLEKYLNNIYLNMLYDKYEEDYINNLDESNFINIYNLFKEYQFYYIEDIIINYLEIFELPKEKVNISILKLKEHLGENFTYIIGNKPSYFDYILENIE